MGKLLNVLEDEHLMQFWIGEQSEFLMDLLAKYSLATEFYYSMSFSKSDILP